MDLLLSRVRRRLLAIALAVLLAALPPQSVRPLSAQTTQPTQTPQPPSPAIPTFRTEIVVTPARGSDTRDRLPVPTAVLTRTDIERLPATTLADVIQALPGFHVLLGADSGLAPAPVARGFFGGGEAEYVKLLIDGVPVSDAESGLVDWRRLPAFAIERIEALRGPGSVVYGDTALGGVVQVFTRARAETFGRVNVSGGSFGARNVGGEFGQPFGAAALSLVASYGATDGFRARSALREGFTGASFRHTRDSRQWTARASFNYLAREEPGALTAEQLSSDRTVSDPMFSADRDTNRRGHGAIRFASNAGRLQYSILGHVSGRTGERFRTLLLAPGLGDRAHRDISTRSAGVTVENSVDLSGLPGASTLRFGVDVVRSDVDTEYHGLNPDNRLTSSIGEFGGDRTQFAAYAAQSLDLHVRVRLHAGIRWDRLADEIGDETTRAAHDAWSPRIGTAVLVTDSARPITAFGQVSRAFKAPTVDQLFDPRPFPDFQGGTFLVSNPALEPQRATNVEGGLRRASPTFRWELVVYRMRVKNEIDFDPATFTYANIRRSTHTGAEVDATLFPRSRVAAAFNYAWTRVSPDDPASSGRQLKNIPRHLFRPELTVTLPRDAMIHVRYTRAAGAFADDHNMFPLRDRSTLDVRLAKRLRRFTARLDLLNVTNDRYEEVGFTLADFGGGVVPFFYPAQGFSIRAGLEFAFQREQ